MANNIRVVLYDCIAEGLKIDHVVADYKPKVVEAIHDYWSDHKDARVGLVVCQSNAYRMREFQEGYMNAMDKYAGDVLMKKIQISLEETEICAQISDFIRHNRLDAVLFSTDRLARIGGETIARERLQISCVIATDVPVLSGDSTVTYVSLKQDMILIAEKIVKGLLS